MFKTLDRYVVKEMLVPLILGTLVVVVMFQANWLIALYKEFQLDRVPPGAILQYILLKTPGFLQLTLPVGVALASSLAVSRMARESELTAIRGAGAPIRRIVVPIMFMGALVAGVNFFIGDYVMPRTEPRAKQLQTEIGMLGTLQPIKQNVMINLDRYAAFFGSVVANQERIDLDDILLIERKGSEDILLVTAKRGVYENGLWTIQEPVTVALRGGTVLTFEPKKDPLIIRERISVPQFFLTPQPEEQTTRQLLVLMSEARKQGRETTWLEVALHMKIAVPLTCLVFALTGPVMAVAFVRRGPFVGVLLSLLVVLLYYNLFVISTQILGRNAWVAPWLAAWAPNLLLLFMGAIWLRKLE